MNQLLAGGIQHAENERTREIAAEARRKGTARPESPVEIRFDPTIVRSPEELVEGAKLKLRELKGQRGPKVGEATRGAVLTVIRAAREHGVTVREIAERLEIDIQRVRRVLPGLAGQTVQLGARIPGNGGKPSAVVYASDYAPAGAEVVSDDPPALDPDEPIFERPKMVFDEDTIPLPEARFQDLTARLEPLAFGTPLPAQRIGVTSRPRAVVGAVALAAALVLGHHLGELPDAGAVAALIYWLTRRG